MRPFMFLIAALLLTGGQSAFCLAQQPSGPRTLENLLNSDEAQKPAATAQIAGADATDDGPKRPAGTVARPKNGVQHPDLDKAWADYEAAVTKAAEGIRGAINKQFDAATAKGDLDAAVKWQTALEKFEKAVELPTEKETKEAVNAATADFKKAKEELTKAYEAVITALTMEKKIADAKAVREEMRRLAASASAPVPSPKPADQRERGFQWRSTVKGWAGGANANNTFAFQVPQHVTGQCCFVLRLGAASSSDTAGRVSLVNPEGREIQVAAWSREDNIPVTGEPSPHVVAQSPANPQDGKEFVIPIGNVKLAPGDYTLRFQYQAGQSALVIHAVELTVK